MKVLQILGLSLCIALQSSNTSAAAAGSKPILHYYSTNGSVAAKYKTSTDCKIVESDVLKETKGGVIGIAKTKNQVAWTVTVPNSNEVLSLLKAATGKKYIVLPKYPKPDGAGIASFSGTYRTKTGKIVNVILSNLHAEKNTSQAAAVLLDFINFNCIHQ